MSGAIGPPRPVPSLRGLSAYHVPKPAWPIDLHLNANEGPPPPPSLFDALKDPELVRRYPSAHALEAKLAARLGVPAACVYVTAGADEAIDRAFRAYVAPGDELVLPSPTFVMFAQYARLAGAVIVAPAWPGEMFPEAPVLAAIGPRTRAVALVSPNNPTGAVIAASTIATIAKAAPHALMLVDYAYIECADADPTKELIAHDNVLVFRTMSKVWGLAGLRVGYVVGPEALVRPLRAAGGPYSVASTSVALAGAQLEIGDAAMNDYVARVRLERDELYSALAERGAGPVRSRANFVFVRFGTRERTAAFCDGLARRGIGVRQFAGDPLLDDGVRITCAGDAVQHARLLTAIGEVLA